MIVRPVVRKEGGLTGHRYQVSNWNHYVVSILIALVLTVFCGWYYLIQRTYLFNAPPEIDACYVPDKVIAWVGMVLLAFTFLIGPIYRYFDAFDYLLEYRKQIGIVGGFFALFHPVVAYFFLPLTFPQSEVPLTSVTYGAGLAGAAGAAGAGAPSREEAQPLARPAGNAEDTGGGFFLLKKTTELASTFTRVAQELHSQYVIGFAPTLRRR